MSKVMRALLIGIGISMTACDVYRVFEDNTVMENAYWKADSVVTYSFQVDAGLPYDLFFNVRNGVDYPHANIYVSYELTDSLGNSLASELRNFQLFHAKSGYPLGSGRNIFEHQFPLIERYAFMHDGTYNIRFQQYMRYDSLPEVYSAGFRLAKSPETN